MRKKSQLDANFKNNGSFIHMIYLLLFILMINNYLQIQILLNYLLLKIHLILNSLQKKIY